LVDSKILSIFVYTKQVEIMVHKLIVLEKDTNGIPKGTKGTIIFEYSTGVYEVEFIVNDKSVTEILTDEDINIFNNIIKNDSY
jgi:hypothetical protein